MIDSKKYCYVIWLVCMIFSFTNCSVHEPKKLSTYDTLILWESPHYQVSNLPWNYYVENLVTRHISKCTLWNFDIWSGGKRLFGCLNLPVGMYHIIAAEYHVSPGRGTTHEMRVVIFTNESIDKLKFLVEPGLKIFGKIYWLHLPIHIPYYSKETALLDLTQLKYKESLFPEGDRTECDGGIFGTCYYAFYSGKLLSIDTSEPTKTNIREKFRPYLAEGGWL